MRGLLQFRGLCNPPRLHTLSASHEAVLLRNLSCYSPSLGIVRNGRYFKLTGDEAADTLHCWACTTPGASIRMGDIATGEKPWNFVSYHLSEEQQIAKWEQLEGHWSGEGKHVINWNGHRTVRVVDKELGSGSFGAVERITYKAVTLARKHVEAQPRRGMTVEKLREEANAMERLAHRHILKLVGTYTLKRNHLYFLLYPAAVCDLNRFLKDIDDIRLDNVADQEDAFKRLHSLGLEAVGTIADLPLLRSSPSASIFPRTATAAGYLQQILGCMTEALAFVHKEDIRHGDLNPKNILLSPGRLYLADFGIARDVRDSENSITGHRYGTPFWMAPEVHDEVDHHRSPADIWSLGCVFLKVMTVLYGEELDKYDETMKEHDWKVKYDMLPKYLDKLRSRGILAGFHPLDAPSFSSKHIIDLIENMLDYNPEKRPTAAQVNFTLSEHGGLDQIYHLECCHKPNSDITEIINKRLKASHLSNCATLLENGQLNGEIERMRDRIRSLEMANETWERRLENERKHLTEQRKSLQDKYDLEVKARKELEERLNVMNNKNRRPRSQNRGRGKAQGALHSNAREYGMARSTSNNNNNNSNATPFQDKTPIQNVQRRQSFLPRPSRPSTPIHSPCNREPGSNSSTLTSSISSTFSRASLKTNESFSSTETHSARSASPNSPRTMKSTATEGQMAPPPQPRFEKQNTMTVIENKPVVHAQKPSWANIAKSASNL